MSSPPYQSRHPVPPNPEPPRQSEHLRVVIALAITIAIFIGVLNGYFQHQRLQQEKFEQSQQTALEEAKAFYQQNDPHACLTALNREFSQSFTAAAQSQRTQCQQAIDLTHLNRARKLANRRLFRRAIDEAKKVTQGDLVNEAKARIQQWSQDILKIAERHYRSEFPGQYERAIDYASSLRGTPLEEAAQAKIQVWEQDWQQEESYFQLAKQYVSEKKFTLAKIELQRIRHPYWKRESQPIWQEIWQPSSEPSPIALPNPPSPEPGISLAPFFWWTVLSAIAWFVRKRYPFF